MGINGLLMNTKSIGVRKHLSDYRNKIVGVDGYAWLHKGIYKCGIEVSLHKNIKGLINYFDKKIKYLLSLNIKIVLVFDGADIPLKKSTNKDREKTRKKNYEKGLNFFKKGDKDNARKYLSLAIDINPEMVYTLKKELERTYHKKSLQFLVAPYEADSQLAYLSKKKFIDIVITEDSDLLVFGATLIFYKMDTNYYGVEYKRENLELCEEINLRNWPNEKFIQLCILAGCDYLDNPKGIGFKTAYSLLNKYDNIKSVINSLKKKINKEYYNKFLAAFCAFKFSRVFCPKQKVIVTLNFINLENVDLENAFEYHAVLKCKENFRNFDFLGKDLNQDIAKKIAFCLINPLNNSQFQGIYKSTKEKSNNFNRMFLQQNLDFLVQKNDLSKEKTKIISKKKEIIKDKKTISKEKIRSKKNSDLLLKYKNYKNKKKFAKIDFKKKIKKEISTKSLYFIEEESKKNISNKKLKIEKLQNIKNSKEDIDPQSEINFKIIDDLISKYKIQNAKRKPNLLNTLKIFRNALNN